MQDRRQLCFILGLVGGIFGVGSGVTTLFVSFFLVGMFPFLTEDTPLAFILPFFGWMAATSLLGGVAAIVGSLRLRQATGPALRSAAIWTLVGGGIMLLGSNLLAAGLAIAAGVVMLGEPQAAA